MASRAPEDRSRPMSPALTTNGHLESCLRGRVNGAPGTPIRKPDRGCPPAGLLANGPCFCLKSTLQNQRRPLVAQAFRPANSRRAALKGCATG